MKDVHAAGRAAAPQEDEDVDAILALETPRLFAIAVAILRDVAEAEDAVQETLMAAWKRWDTIRDPVARPRWLTRICVRQSIRARARLARLPLLGLDRHRVEAPALARDVDMDRPCTGGCRGGSGLSSHSTTTMATRLTSVRS